MIIDGKKIAAELREELKKKVAEIKSKFNSVPGSPSGPFIGISLSPEQDKTKKHIKITLINNRFVIKSKTPSDKNATWGLIRDVKRELAFNL